MHYYGTYALALAAGIPNEEAETVAYAAQFVDDATSKDSEVNRHDGGLLVGFTTAHHTLECALPENKDPIYQRKVWVPCHFVPGGEGKNLEERSLCQKNSPIAREMMQNHVNVAATGKPFGLELLGMAVHAYMDTFAHYGFTGFSSKFNKIRSDSLKVHPKEKAEEKRLLDKIAKAVSDKVNLCMSIPSALFSIGAETFSGDLGHGGVLSLPDHPYLKWEFEFLHDRPGNGSRSVRNNLEDYLVGCKETHAFLCDFAKKRYADAKPTPFEEMEESVRKILSTEGDKVTRANRWKQSGLIPDNAKYASETWEREKAMFDEYIPSEKGIGTHVYSFHQAAAYHRYYMLKDLLPAHGLAVH